MVSFTAMLRWLPYGPLAELFGYDAGQRWCAETPFLDDGGMEVSAGASTSVLIPVSLEEPFTSAQTSPSPPLAEISTLVSFLTKPKPSGGNGLKSANVPLNKTKNPLHTTSALEAQEEVDGLAAMIIDPTWVDRPESLRQETIRQLQELSDTFRILPRRLELTPMSDRRHLGGGGEAQIWRRWFKDRYVVARECQHPEDGDWESETGKEALKFLRREVITLLQIRHRNIAPFLGVSTDEHHPLALISPHYQNGDALWYLKRSNEQKRLNSAIQMSIAVASALYYLHSLAPPIVHGDINPHNIVVDDGGNALLIDFGLARFKHDVTRSKTNIVAGGTYRYLAPELLAAMLDGTPFRTTAASDCYAFSMTILSLLTLKSPFVECAHELNVTKRVERGKRPSRPSDHLELLPRDASERLWGLLEEMWDQDPNKRPNLDVVHTRLGEIYILVDWQ